MTSILEVIKAIIQLIPLLLELVKIFKGQPVETQKEAAQAAKEAARLKCELGGGVGCPSGPKGK